MRASNLMVPGENASNKTANTNEALKMRRIKNNINRSNNPAILFASGFESLVSDQLRNPSKYDNEEQQVMERKANKKDVPVNLISLFFHQLFWSKSGKSV